MVRLTTCTLNQVGPAARHRLSNLSFVMTGWRVHLLLIDVFDLRDGATQDSFLFLFGQLVRHHLNSLDPLVPCYQGNKWAISCDKAIFRPGRLFSWYLTILRLTVKSVGFLHRKYHYLNILKTRSISLRTKIISLIILKNFTFHMQFYWKIVIFLF